MSVSEDDLDPGSDWCACCGRWIYTGPDASPGDACDCDHDGVIHDNYPRPTGPAPAETWDAWDGDRQWGEPSSASIWPAREPTRPEEPGYEGPET